MSDLIDPHTSTAPGPLEGIRVLEFTQIVAGPIAGLHLADLGADVIKLEPPTGDQTRRTSSAIPDESKVFQALNRGKRSLALDLHDERAVALVHKLIKEIDVVLINYRLGVPERLGIDYKTLSAINPGLVYWQNSGFGEAGDFAMRGASDVVAQAYSGLMVVDAKTDDDGAPEPMGSPLSDISTGIAAAMGVCAALLHRDRTGEGQYIGTSLLRTGLSILQQHVIREPVHDSVMRDPFLARVEETVANGGSYDDILRVRTESYTSTAAFRIYYGGYRAKDGAVVLGALTRANRDGMRKVLGVEDEPSDQPDFDILDPEIRASSEKWKNIIREKFLTKTVAEWIELFDEAGVPAAPVNLPEEMADDPQVNADGMIWDLDHAVTGPQRVVGPIISMSRTPTRVQLPSPALGQHSAEILGSLGVSTEEIASLAEDQVTRLF